MISAALLLKVEECLALSLSLYVCVCVCVYIYLVLLIVKQLITHDYVKLKNVFFYVLLEQSQHLIRICTFS